MTMIITAWIFQKELDIINKRIEIKSLASLIKQSLNRPLAVDLDQENQNPQSSEETYEKMAENVAKKVTGVLMFNYAQYVILYTNDPTNPEQYKELADKAENQQEQQNIIIKEIQKNRLELQKLCGLETKPLILNSNNNSNDSMVSTNEHSGASNHVGNDFLTTVITDIFTEMHSIQEKTNTELSNQNIYDLVKKQVETEYNKLFPPTKIATAQKRPLSFAKSGDETSAKICLA